MKKKDKKNLTTAWGATIPDDRNSITAGEGGRFSCRTLSPGAAGEPEYF